MFESEEMRNGYILGRLVAKGATDASANEALSAQARKTIDAAELALPNSLSRPQQIRELASALSTQLAPAKVDDARVQSWLTKDLPKLTSAKSRREAFAPRRGFVADEGVRNALRALVSED